MSSGMTDKPEALRLADECDEGMVDFAEVAAELRRLHAENEKFRKHIEGQNKELDQLIPMAERLEAQRDELLEALQAIMALPDHAVDLRDAAKQARVAIAKAEGQK